MKQSLAAVAVALGISVALVNAQDTKTTTTTKVSGDSKAQTVTYTGCIQSGTESKTYILNKVVPVSRTTP